MELIPTTVKLPSPPVAVLTIEPKVAETATAPFPTPDAKPAPGPVALIVATLPLLVPHVTVDVKS